MNKEILLKKNANFQIKSNIVLILAIFTFFTSIFSSMVFAQENKEAIIYRWRDDRGIVNYSDKIKIGNKKEVTVFNSELVVKKSIEAALTEEEYKDKQSKIQLDEDSKKKGEASKKRDNLLLVTYASPKEIEELKNSDLAQIERNIKNDTEILISLKERKNTLEFQASRNNEENTKNDKLDKQVSQTDKDIIELDRVINKNKSLYSDKEKKYNSDMDRLKELTKK